MGIWGLPDEIIVLVPILNWFENQIQNSEENKVLRDSLHGRLYVSCDDDVGVQGCTYYGFPKYIPPLI